MTRIAVFIASAAINAASVPALASECMFNHDVAARLATMRNLPAGPTSDDKTLAWSLELFDMAGP
ncbi:hypothetical protein [Bradyrhizobium uaiense]|uniref:hypothetical protein n=1 Tax=Bradyrhizobium uaiense TaxID=2594946 RepID=UPI0013D358F5|nr:hypothetical protein [Bradyrhizobium uaiense]